MPTKFVIINCESLVLKAMIECATQIGFGRKYISAVNPTMSCIGKIYFFRVSSMIQFAHILGKYFLTRQERL